MAKMEHIREMVTGTLDPQTVRQRLEAGWELVAVEWQRPTEGTDQAPLRSGEDVPYGSRLASDCAHLEDNPPEMNALALILELIVQDRSLSRMAETLNERGFRTREGHRWTEVSVYKMLPRLIEVSPRIFDSPDWIERRKQIPAMG